MKKKMPRNQDAGWAANKLIESLKTRGDNEAMEELYHIAGGALEAMQQLATKGDALAAKVLIMTLNEAINQLYEQQHKQREIYTKLARNLQCWPGFISVDRDWKKLNEDIAEQSELAKDTPLNYGGKKSWTRTDNPENVAALEIVNARVRANRTLCRLGKPCVPLTDAVKKSVVVRLYGERFEEHPLFAEKYLPKVKTRSDDSLKSSTWMRKQILSKINQALRVLTKKKLARPVSIDPHPM